MKNKFKLIIVFTLMMSFYACEKDTTKDPTQVNDSFDIHCIVNKTVENPSNISGMVCYYKNGNLVWSSDPSKNNFAISLFVDSNDVYITGYERTDSINSKPKYWKNGIEYYLPCNQQKGYATSICISDGDVLLCGYGRNLKKGTSTDPLYFAKYWKNGEEIDLYNSTSFCEANTIIKKEQDLYFSGVSNVKINSVPCSVPVYWKNGSMVTLSTPKTIWENGYTDDMKLIGNDIYIVGNENNKPVFWKNGSISYLPSPYNNIDSISSSAIDIAFDGNNVYIIGIAYLGYTNKFMMWKNGILNTSIDELSNSSNLKIDAMDDKLVAGFTNENSWGYWNNGQVKSFEGSQMYIEDVYLTKK